MLSKCEDEFNNDQKDSIKTIKDRLQKQVDIKFKTQSALELLKAEVGKLQKQVPLIVKEI